jgi:hypothetical protein
MTPMGVQACYGGNWDNGAHAGLFCANANNAPSNANSNIGARLAKDIFGQKPDGLRSSGQRLSFGACVLSPWLEDQQPRAASSRNANAARATRAKHAKNV